MSNGGFTYSITIPPECVKAVGDYVLEQLKPLLSHKQADKDELLTADEAAEFLKTTKDQIYQWVNKSQHGLGTFPYYKSGRLLRFSKKEIMQWLKSNGKR